VKNPSPAAARDLSSLDDLGALWLFVRVVEARSFTRAARLAGTTTSAVSKRMASLEARLGLRLLQRTTRAAAPTEAGLVLYQRSLGLLAEASATEDAVLAFRGKLVGTLRVSAAVTFGQTHIFPLVARFLELHPAVRVSLSLSDRSVDLVAEGIDVAVRAGRVVDSSLMSRKLAPDRRVVCATPQYLERFGTPRVPGDLRDHACLRHPLMLRSGGWPFVMPMGEITVAVNGRLDLDNVGSLREAALASMGLALIPAYAVGTDLREGRLRTVLDEFIPEAQPFRALWVAGRQPLAYVQAFVEYLARELPPRL
jgi:DNA-binding transcriptional LysR family regulator